MKKLIPADTVDAEGNAWKTVGENIRNGAKDINVDAIIAEIFPVGSIYCGENQRILTVGTWEQVTTNAGSLIGLGTTTVTASTFESKLIGTEKSMIVSIRMWRRVA